jgi:hypothetical protein
MDRRTLITIGSISLIGATSAARAQSKKPDDSKTPEIRNSGAAPAESGDTLPVSGLYPGGWSSLLHVWTDPQGVSHAEHVVISKNVKPIAVTQMMIRPETHGFVDWHNPRLPGFAISIEGDLEVEVTDGTRLALPPSKLAFLEDMTGKGHITRTRDVVNLFISTPPGFDVRRWARGES